MVDQISGYRCGGAAGGHSRVDERIGREAARATPFVMWSLLINSRVDEIAPYRESNCYCPFCGLRTGAASALRVWDFKALHSGVCSRGAVVDENPQSSPVCRSPRQGNCGFPESGSFKVADGLEIVLQQGVSGQTFGLVADGQSTIAPSKKGQRRRPDHLVRHISGVDFGNAV